MIIKRSDDQSSPAILSISYKLPDSSQAVEEPSKEAVYDKIETIDMKNKDAETIMNKLMAVTKAQQIPTTSEDTRQLEEFDAHHAVVKASSARNAIIVAEKRKSTKLLESAKAKIA
ncbi:MAG: hypothetical protein M1814_001215 [Vezdaea aestivalis]|nr:MAG: hypothetical protein M1814_001215 [Vezdaea aestivalis]